MAIKIDLNPIVGAILEVAVEPFWELLHKLESEGRVSEQELEDLRSALRQRGEHLADLVEERLPASAEERLPVKVDEDRA